MEGNYPEWLSNRLLSALPSQERERLIARSDILHMARGQTVHEPGEPVRYVYLPLSALFSLVGVTGEGDSLELCQVGTEGVVGISSLSGSHRIYQHRMMRNEVRLSGRALRVSTDHFLAALVVGSRLFLLLSRYLDILFGHLAIGATCNRHHSLEQRCTRWLLSIQDRLETQAIQITRENIAELLGVRRQSIDIVLDSLERETLISCSRGRIDVNDRKGLETAVCECYFFTRRRLEGFPASEEGQ